MKNKARTVLVAGRGAAAAAVVDALGGLQGVGCVRQIGEFDASKAATQLAGGDVLIEMVGGVTPAFNTAMAALGQGMACITANPLLIAAHGRVLNNAAVGQQAYFGFQAAGFGMPVAELVGALRPKRVTVSYKTAPGIALARMAYRNETLGTVSAHMKMQKMDLSDWGGKQTQARAMALRALWHGEELRGAQLGRVGVDFVEAMDIKRLRGFGLQPVFGAEITEHGIYTGPLAVAPDSALVQVTNGDVLVADTEAGEVVLRHDADDVQGLVAGVLADLRQYLRTPRPALGHSMKNFEIKAPTGLVRAYVRVPFAAREQVLAVKPEIFSERVDGDGLWQGVIGLTSLDELRVGSVGGMVYPVNGAWAAPVAGSLRLVG